MLCNTRYAIVALLPIDNRQYFEPIRRHLEAQPVGMAFAMKQRRPDRGCDLDFPSFDSRQSELSRFRRTLCFSPSDLTVMLTIQLVFWGPDGLALIE